MVKQSKNPQQMMMNLMQNNPRMKQVNDLIKQSGGNPEKAFRDYANKLGVNPDEIINMLK